MLPDISCPACGGELAKEPANRTRICVSCHRVYSEAELHSDDPKPLGEGR